MKKLYSVGEMKKLTGLNVSTLRYYDETGLIRPSKIDQKTGYRYYAYEQICQIELIQLCKRLGIGLKDIKRIIEAESTELTDMIIEQQRQKLLADMEAIERSLSQINYYDAVNIKHTEGIDLYRVTQKSLERRQVLMAELKEPADEDAVHVRYHQLFGSEEYCIRERGHGFLLDEHMFLEEKAGLLGEFIKVDQVRKDEEHYVYTFPKGEYICVDIPFYAVEWVPKIVRYLKVRDLRPRMITAVQKNKSYFDRNESVYTLEIFI